VAELVAGCELGSGDVVGPYDINPFRRGRGRRQRSGSSGRRPQSRRVAHSSRARSPITPERQQILHGGCSGRSVVTPDSTSW
jgi:hypothetical protein